MRRVIGMLLLLAAPLAAQRDSALKLFDRGKQLEALPILASLYHASPDDRQVAADYGFALLGTAAALPDLSARRAQRLLARTALMRARTLGDPSLVIASVIDALGASGGDDPHFSLNSQVDSAMSRGERAYGTGDLPAALAGYHEALSLDPRQYDAAVFLGDTFYRMNSIDSSLAWYRNAIAIDPDRELAHRFMSDVMLKNNMIKDGLQEAICAVVVEPFNRSARQGIVQAANKIHVAMSLPVVDLPPRDTASHSVAAAAYDSVHRAWRGTPGVRSAAFVAQYPGDSVYRPSLAEEMAALRAAAATADTTPTTENIRRLDADHELEPFIFFTRANTGVAADYRPYRKTHTFELMMFWLNWVMHRN